MTLVQKLQRARRLRAQSLGRRPLSMKHGGRPRGSSRTNRSTRGGEDSLRESSTLQASGLGGSPPASSDETASQLQEAVTRLSEQLATAEVALERHTSAEARDELQPPASATGGGAGNLGEPVQPATGTPARGRFEVRPATSATRGAAAAGHAGRVAAVALGRPAPGWHGDMRRFR
jgi:hypothetical protein